MFRRDNRDFSMPSVAEAMNAAAANPDCLMVNRNAGSGTRALIDRLLDGARPAGYMHQAKSHNAVAVAVAQDRADLGMAIDTVARQYGPGFVPVQPLTARITERQGPLQIFQRLAVLSHCDLI